MGYRVHYKNCPFRGLNPSFLGLKPSTLTTHLLHQSMAARCQKAISTKKRHTPYN